MRTYPGLRPWDGDATSPSRQSVPMTSPTLITSPLPQRDRPTVGRRVGFAWVVLSSLSIVAVAISTYTAGTIESLAEQEIGLAQNYASLPAVFQYVLYVHIASASVALLIGPAQFATALRTRFNRLHRALGRTYLVAVAVGGVAGLVLAPVNEAGFVGFFGFGMLAGLWLFTAVKAYRAVRARDFRSHQAWMIRNFALTYAAVTLRIWLGLLVATHLLLGFDEGMTFANAYAAVPFLAWLPNIVVAEILIARRGLPGLRWYQSGLD